MAVDLLGSEGDSIPKFLSDLSVRVSKIGAPQNYHFRIGPEASAAAEIEFSGWTLKSEAKSGTAAY